MDGMSVITQSELDDLATMANGCLLPIVNNYMATEEINWVLNTGYDKHTGYYSYPGVYASPQPPYSFKIAPFENLVPSGSVFGVDGSFQITITETGDYDVLMGQNEGLDEDEFSFRVNIHGYNFYVRCLYITEGQTVTVYGTAGNSVTAIISKSQSTFINEINRIRGDAMGLLVGPNGTPVPGGEVLYKNRDAVMSGPWVVGVVDMDTFPNNYFGGIFSRLSGSVVNLPGFPIFRNVEFVGHDLPDGFLVYSGNVGFPLIDITPGFRSTSDDEGELTIFIRFASDYGTAIWDDIGFSCPSADSVTLISTESVSGGYWFHVKIVITLSSGVSDHPFSYGIPDGHIGTSVEEFRLVTSSIGDLAPCNAIGYAEGSKISSIDVGGFLMERIDSIGAGENFAWGVISWWISDQTVKGIWIAKTLPIPANNVFLDQDIPTYIGKDYPEFMGYTEGNKVTASVSKSFNGTGPRATSMRQQSPIEAENKVNPMSPGLTARPAKWPAFRDTDSFTPTVPFFQYSRTALYWDETHEYGLNDYARADFGRIYRGRHALNTGNPLPARAQDDNTYWWALVPVDAMGVAECFSYVLNGSPGVKSFTSTLSGDQSNMWHVKPIPKSGYCIFSVRATRMAESIGNGINITPTSGNEIVVKIGQKISGVFTPFKSDDGIEDLTITIPATGRDTGDVKVFIPVLDGNELIWQSDSLVVFEACVNWQPIFFNVAYSRGQFPIDPQYGFNTAEPEIFQHALSFENHFDVTSAGWAFPRNRLDEFGSGTQPPAVVVYPVFRELYDDLVALLKLLGGELPDGNTASGAGGSGSAGDNIGSGDDNGGGML